MSIIGLTSKDRGNVKMIVLKRISHASGLMQSGFQMTWARSLAILSTGVFLTACTGFLCETLDPFSAKDVLERGGPVITVNASEETVFKATEDYLTANGYTLCNSLAPATEKNFLEPCLGSCGATSSRTNGLVVAEKMFLSPKRVPILEFTPDGYLETSEGGKIKKVTHSIVGERDTYQRLRIRVFVAIEESQGGTILSYDLSGAGRGIAPNLLYDPSKITGTDASAQFDREKATLEESLLGGIAKAVAR